LWFPVGLFTRILTTQNNSLRTRPSIYQSLWGTPGSKEETPNNTIFFAFGRWLSQQLVAQLETGRLPPGERFLTLASNFKEWGADLQAIGRAMTLSSLDVEG
jgi:hypothetical protein